MVLTPSEPYFNSNFLMILLDARRESCLGVWLIGMSADLHILYSWRYPELSELDAILGEYPIVRWDCVMVI
jgi:hypothetical protein